VTNISQSFYVQDGGRNQQAYRVGQKTGPQTYDHNSVIILNRFKIFFTGRFPDKFAVKRISKIPSHLVFFATLLRETSMSTKQAINDKLQGSVATCLRCSGVANNLIKKGLLLSL